MADTITEKSTLQLEYAFVDGDTRLANIQNPNSSITSAQIEELNQFIRANNLIVGDKYGGTFAQINKATKIRKTTTNIEIDN